MSEHDTQAAFFKWASLQHIDGIELLHAIPNGGERHPAVAAKLKAEGVKAGVPDVYWPVARGAFVGLAIEFKHGNNNPTKEQSDRIERMLRNGWCVTVCRDWEAAVRFLKGYAGMLQIVLTDGGCGE